MPCLVDHLRVEGLDRARPRLDVGRVDRCRGRGIEAGLDQRARRQHQQLGVVLGLDLRVGHAGQEAHLAPTPARVRRGTPRTTATPDRCVPGLPKPGRSRSQFSSWSVGAHLRHQQRRVLEDSSCEQTRIEHRHLRTRQRRERLRVLEGEAVGQVGPALAGRTEDAIGVVGRICGRGRCDPASTPARLRRADAAPAPDASRCGRWRAGPGWRDWGRGPAAS